ncbi:unnamed protein product [Penicillium bialowiezense]
MLANTRPTYGNSRAPFQHRHSRNSERGTEYAWNELLVFRGMKTSELVAQPLTLMRVDSQLWIGGRTGYLAIWQPKALEANALQRTSPGAELYTLSNSLDSSMMQPRDFDKSSLPVLNKAPRWFGFLPGLGDLNLWRETK